MTSLSLFTAKDIFHSLSSLPKEMSQVQLYRFQIQQLQKTHAEYQDGSY